MSIKNAMFLAAAMITPALTAATITYTDRSVWQSNVTNVSTTDFEAQAPNAGNRIGINTTGGITISGIQYIGHYGSGNVSMQIVNAGPAEPWFQWNSGAILVTDEASQDKRLQINLPADTFSFGMDLMAGGAGSAGSNFTVRLNGAVDYAFNTAVKPDHSFFGVTSDVAISTIEVMYGQNTYVVLDNFSTANFVTGGGGTEPGPGQETPEASTILLCATGFFVLARLRRKILVPSKQRS